MNGRHLPQQDWALMHTHCHTGVVVGDGVGVGYGGN